MKNIQVIDGADNCSYSIYAAEDADFQAIFPQKGQDVEFIDDVLARISDEDAERIFTKLWKQRVDKKSVVGIHGTLFYELDFKREFYPTKREDAAVTGFEPSL